jgi:RNA polymerase-binding transcription factor DksA
MANKKKPVHKKAAKPVKKVTAKKPAAKKPAAKKPVKKIIAKKPTKPVAKKAKKIVAKKVIIKKQPKPIVKPVTKKPVEKPAPVVVKKPVPAETKSLVSVKPAIKQIVKKEPPKPSKVVIPKTSTKSVKKYEPDFTKSVLDTRIQDPSLPSQRYSDTELNEFRDLIQKKLDAAKKELNYLQGLITRKDESGDMDEGRYMTMEDGSVSMEREQLSQMASRQITFIDHLEKAMMRIENKTYGICRITGKLIDKARLRAVPHATLSIEAKQMMNK